MQSNWLARATVTAACGAAATLAIAAPAWAASAPSGDPKGGNGTVKIDGLPFDDGIDNEPHVTCQFRVKFFNFDLAERANIVFTAHKPTGSGQEVLRRDNVLVSNDAAGGGKPDPDEIITFSVSDLALAGYTPHPRQGYHVKLTVERIGAPGAGKHKVFWVKPCAEPGSPPQSPQPSGSPGPQPSGSASPTPTGSAAPSSSPSSSPSGDASGEGGGDSGGADLPVTGFAVGGVVALGAGLVAGGTALMTVRRKRRFTA